MRKAALALNAQLDALTEQRERITGLKAVRYGGYSGRSPMLHGDDPLVNALALMESLEADASKAVAECRRYVDALANAITRADLDATQRAALRLHYLDGWTFERVAQSLYLSQRQVYNVTDSALDKLWYEMPPSERTTIPDALG